MPSELIFRAQLIYSEQRQIYDYWCRQAARKLMPSLTDFDVQKISEVAPSISLLEIYPTFQHSIFKSAGTLSKKIYGFDLTAKAISEIEWGKYNRYWDKVYTQLLNIKRPRCGASRGPENKTDDTVIFWLRLPLSEDGLNVTHIICHDMDHMHNCYQNIPLSFPSNMHDVSVSRAAS